ncbi:ATP synthase F1 subunit delta [Candidatus Falkowbacteria bacterium]|nr:ATP synthase F1 subunit delta [Candidatus Falkowbacteria bacterium]
MKIKPKQYAISLFESLDEADAREQKDIVKKFVKTLIENNDVSKTEAILMHFSNLNNRRADAADTEIVSSHDLDKKLLDALKDFVSKRAGAKEITMIERKDKKLLGGVILRYGDKLLDLSLRRKLEEFKREIID